MHVNQGMSCIKALKTGKKTLIRNIQSLLFQGIYEALCKNTQIMGSVLEILLTQVIISLTSGRHLTVNIYRSG